MYIVALLSYHAPVSLYHVSLPSCHVRCLGYKPIAYMYRSVRGLCARAVREAEGARVAVSCGRGVRARCVFSQRTQKADSNGDSNTPFCSQTVSVSGTSAYRSGPVHMHLAPKSRVAVRKHCGLLLHCSPSVGLRKADSDSVWKPVSGWGGKRSL